MPVPGQAAAPPPPVHIQAAAPPPVHGMPPPRAPYPQPPHPPQPGFHPNEPWRVQGPKRRKFPAALVLTIVGVLVVASAGGYGLYVLLSGGADEPTATAADVQIADSLFKSDQNAQSDGTKQSIRDVAAVGNTIVAVGGEDGGAIPRPRFLVSTDQGRTWRIAQVKSEDGREPAGDAANAVVGSDAGWVALGGDGDFRVAWTSTDGLTWNQVGGQVSAFRGGDEIEQMARTPQGFIAVGHTAAGGGSAPVVWLSPDGRSWQRLDKGRLELPTTAGSASRLRYVAVAGNVVMISGEVVKSKSVLAGLWRSTDNGRTWETVEAPNRDGAFGATHLTSGTTGFITLREGKSGDDRFGLTFQSRDGVSWQPGGRIATSSGETTEFLRLSGGEQGYAILVKVQGDRTLLYRSDDGTNWQRTADLGNDPNRNVNGVAVTGSMTLIGGTRLGPDQDLFLDTVDDSGTVAELGLEKIPDAINADRAVDDIVTAGGRIVAVGASNGSAAVWTSADGTAWTRGDTGSVNVADSESRFKNVVQGPAGWLAIGQINDKPLVATSSDGNSWRRVDDKLFVPGRGLTLSLNGAAYGPAGYVIVGSEIGSGSRSSAVIFTSRDLRTWRPADQNDLEFAEGSWRRMLGVTATSAGYVAIGTAADPALSPDAQSQPGVWTSRDGVRWTLQRPSLPSGATTGFLNQVAAKGNSVTALGVGRFSGGGRRIFAVISTDAGTTWRVTSVPAPNPAPGAATDVTSLIATTNGFAAVGTTGRPRESDVVVWTSGDGGSWQMSSPQGRGLSGAGVQRIRAITQNGDSLLGVGLTADYRAEHVTLWRRPVG
jgi:hypothetical protein